MGGLEGWLKSIGEALGLGPPAPPPPPKPVVIPPPLAGAHGDAEALLSATNAARGGDGKPPLRLDPRLTAAALKQATDCAAHGVLGHVGSDGSTHADRIRAAGYPAGPCSENAFVAPPWPAGPPEWGTAAHAVLGWMESTVGHRSNVLGPWSDLGGARAVAADGTVYWIAVYCRPRS